MQLVLKKNTYHACLHGQIEQKVIEVHPRNFDHCTDQKCILTFFHIFIIAIFLITLIFKILYYLKICSIFVRSVDNFDKRYVRNKDIPF